MMCPKSLNLPNILSLSRVFLVPLIMVFLMLRSQLPIYSITYIGKWALGDLVAGSLFIAASITDAFDGYIARKRGLVTTLGKFIDPLADKIMVVAILVALVELGRVPSWIVVVIIAREFIVSGLRMVAATSGVVIAASKWGKVKTISQMIGIIFLIFDIPGGIPVMWTATALTIYSGWDYLIKGSELLEN